ncbi:MAG: amidophosphoribosyltransferase [Deltaproteobacteria bacterium]|nr:amidophosphoribosyltransferase [Deltaproteobacteria bacterium]
MGGFFGVVSKRDCTADLFYGTDYHSHLGTQRGGLVTKSDAGFKRNIHDIRNTPFRTKFEEELPKHDGPLGLGIISDYEDQPLLIVSHHGAYAIVTVGKLNNIDAIVSEVLKKHSAHFSEFKGNEYNQTELVAALINRQSNLVEGIQYAQSMIEGSCSLMLLTDSAIYAARDRLGRTPVVIGKKADGFAITQESCALPNLGYEVDRELGPAEIVRVTAEGVERLAPPGDQMQICAFLWIYYGYPASTYESINVESVRYRCGAALARGDKVKIDFVSGIPDSGIGHAIGYAVQAGVPYQRPYVKYTPTWPRSFMPQEQRVRDLVARMKLIPIGELIKDKKILFCEDSIVRGTQLKDIIQRVFEYGAKEIHMRAACPPLIYGCNFLNFSRSKSELDLAARKAISELEGAANLRLDQYADATTERYRTMVERIRQRMGLTTLSYQKLDDMIEAIGLPKEKLCSYCWTGH